MARLSAFADRHSAEVILSDTFGDELRQAYSQTLQHGSDIDPVLEKALSHVLAHPGNLARPRLSLQIGLAYGAEKRQSLNLAVALEYFHTASLLFDDLPCMDDATVRRGTQCVHRLYGEPAAILTALALVNRAYGLVWSAMCTIPSELRERVFSFLNERLGVDGLLNGQSLDLSFQSGTRGFSDAERVARKKTVPLIEVALVLPALLGEAPQRDVQLLQRLSVCWGLAYQLADDLKDILVTQSLSGKSTERDGKLGRPNTALVIGVAAAFDRLGRLIHTGDRVMERLLLARPSLDFLREFRTNLRNELTKAIEEAGAIPIDRAR